MPSFRAKSKAQSARISRTNVTEETLTARAGMALFSRYLAATGLPAYLATLFASLRKSGKGIALADLFKQLLCFFFDGTSRHLTFFDELKQKAGYAAAIETRLEEMASSHQVKRLLAKFTIGHRNVFRCVLRELFRWRLRQQQPEVVVLGLDTTVLENTYARAREGVSWTYKQTPGFQPLHLSLEALISWGSLIIDGSLRAGRTSGNRGRLPGQMIRSAAKVVRAVLGEETPIIVRMDAGFFDQKLFRELEEAGIFYVTAGRCYPDVKTMADSLGPEEFTLYSNGKARWRWAEWFNCRSTWRTFRRLIYLETEREQEGQQVFAFARRPSVLYTNLSSYWVRRSSACREALQPYLEGEAIVRLYHGRGADELVHRALKDFGSRELPLKRFEANTAVYYLLLISFFLMETFKEDVARGVVPTESYARRLRRTLIDMAGKIVRSGRQVILRVTTSVWNGLNWQRLWQRAAEPPDFAPAYLR